MSVNKSNSSANATFQPVKDILHAVSDNNLDRNIDAPFTDSVSEPVAGFPLSHEDAYIGDPGGVYVEALGSVSAYGKDTHSQELSAPYASLIYNPSLPLLHNTQLYASYGGALFDRTNGINQASSGQIAVGAKKLLYQKSTDGVAVAVDVSGAFNTQPSPDQGSSLTASAVVTQPFNDTYTGNFVVSRNVSDKGKGETDFGPVVSQSVNDNIELFYELDGRMIGTSEHQMDVAVGATYTPTGSNLTWGLGVTHTVLNEGDDMIPDTTVLAGIYYGFGKH